MVVESIMKDNQKTELEMIPEDWDLEKLGNICNLYVPMRDKPKEFGGTIPWLRIEDLDGKFVSDSKSGQYVTSETVKKMNLVVYPVNTVLCSCSATIGVCAITKLEIITNQTFIGIHPNTRLRSEFLYYFLLTQTKELKKIGSGSTILYISREKFEDILIGLPKLDEQEKIIKSLSDIDQLIIQLDSFIEKKKNIKKGTTQELLTGKKRLEGFDGQWSVKTLRDCIDSLDHLRVPLNHTQREKIRGDYPYCGANGVLDYINDYVIDDDFILIAEDGGYFDEYESRPIAYKMSGKCWVNNHAHILKSKKGFNQDFIFYSLIHKNILKFLSGGTRAKLNKSEMYKIEINIPINLEEQSAISKILLDMDFEITKLQLQRDKYDLLKEGMMQKLLTGEIRLK